MKNLPIIPIQECVARYPDRMEGWQYFRIEYGGVNEGSITSGGIWLPPHVDIQDVVRVMKGLAPLR